MRSHALDAIDRKQRRIYEAASDEGRKSKRKFKKELLETAAKYFISDLETSWMKEFDGLCLGRNVRIKSDTVSGGALINEEKPTSPLRIPGEVGHSTLISPCSASSEWRVEIS